MSTAVASSVRTPSNQEPVQLQRAVRALIGWMRPADAKATLAGIGTLPTTEHEEVVTRACAAVAARRVAIDQADLISPAAPELADHIDRLRQNPASIAYFNEGWSVVIADLTRVCAVQPQVATDDATSRAAAIEMENFTSIAEVTLPIGVATPIAAAYNGDKRAWVFSSRPVSDCSCRR